MKYNSKEHLNEICTLVDLVSPLGGKLSHNLRSYCKADQILVRIDDEKADAEKGMWDGELLIETHKLSTEEIVNFLIGVSSADEIGMEKGVLRLWWD